MKYFYAFALLTLFETSNPIAAEADPVTESEPLPAQTPNWKIHNIRPDYLYARNFQRNISDFSLAGPYVRLSVDF